ncbi:PAS domain S-box protein [Lujinxingia vulgaris]|uniref:histidine kinase n=1 Tax=Lujinxingia vulgaris TaxID=2600176 RepID=A0A5C6X8W1_9DELT|nr:PAS domain S-box protein [Lujinxingia vulgaris]TXD36131.1 PAS domain S-box protein [Lujinxingia vulgaris]
MSNLLHWQSIADASRDPALVINRDAFIRYASASARTLFDLDGRPLHKRPFTDLLPPELHEHFTHAYHDFFELPRPFLTSELAPVRGIKRDGSEFPAYVSLFPLVIDGDLHALATIRDVSTLVDTQRALELSQKSLRDLIEALPDGVAVHSNDHLLLVNQRLADDLGYDSPDELIGTRLSDLIHPTHRANASARLSHMNHSGASLPPTAGQLIRKDGSIMEAEVRAQPVIFEGKNAFVGIASDLTYKRKFLAHAIRANRKLALASLAAGAAHEINNPLGYATANVDFVLRTLQNFATQPPSSEEHDALIDALNDTLIGLKRIGEIVLSLKSYTDLDELPTSNIDVNPAITRALNMVRHAAPPAIDFDCQLAAPLPSVCCTEEALSDVLIHLLTNAAQSFEPERTLTSTAPSAHPPRIVITTWQENDVIFLRVEDNGAGIPDDIQPQLFDPFFTTHPAGQASGLGLTTAKNIVEKFRGGIELQSNIGRGTTVTIWLPAASSEHSSA